MHRKGFTLVEIMIVVLIIGILMSIAVPQWMRARDSARSKSCLENLSKIETSKEQWAMNNRKNTGDAVVEADLWPDYIKGTAFPTCSAGGVYTINPVSTQALCSVHGAP